MTASNAGRRNESYLAGVALATEGKIDQAIATFEKALQADPHNAFLLDATGAAYSWRGDLGQAKKYFVKCLAEDPGFVPAHKNLAITYFSLGQYELAISEFHKLKSLSSPASPIADLFLGMIAEKNSNHAQAVILLHASGALLGQYPEAIMFLARAYIALKERGKAQDILAEFDKATGITASQYLEAADLFAQLGLNAKALAELDNASLRGASPDQIAYRRSLLLDQMNRSTEALAILRHLAAKTRDSSTLHLLAQVAQKNGDLALAMQSLREAAKLDPTREDNYLDFSTICADHENYRLALEAADVGLDHIPESYRLSVQKGVVLEHLGRIEQAEDILRKAGQLQTENSEALLSLAIVQTHAGQLQQAEATLVSALSKYPDNYYMHHQLGKVLLQLQEANPYDSTLITKAKRAFEEAVRCNPSFADSYYELSRLYRRESPKLAEQNLVKCLQLNANYAPAEYALARLYLSTGRRAEGQALMDRFERQREADRLKDKKKPRIELAQK